MTRRLSTPLLGLLVSYFAAGCATTRDPSLEYASRQIPGSARLAAFDAAQRILVHMGYRLDTVDAESGVITTRPTAAEPDTGAAARSTLSSTGMRRRMADLYFVDNAGETGVYCRVAVQLCTTEAHRMFRRETAGADVPNETAIDRGADFGAERSAVWKSVRRDKAAERRILEAVLAGTRDNP